MRSKVVDNLKGIGIFLVVMGHCIQYGSGANYLTNGAFYENNIFRFIYTFHMPLFMLISGYLFYLSVQHHHSKYIVQSKIDRCIVPVFCWTFVGGYYFIY